MVLVVCLTPVMYSDISGEFPDLITMMILDFIAGAISGAVSVTPIGWFGSMVLCIVGWQS